MNKKQPRGPDNFDILASDISKKERKDILNRINPSDIEIHIPSASEEAAKLKEKQIKEEAALTRKGLINKFQHESIVKKMMVWVKSLLFNQSVEDIYNYSMVSSIAKKVEHDFPALINYRQRCLCGGAYRIFSSLSETQVYVKEVLGTIDENTGLFYFILGSIVMPDVVDEIKAATDPFNKYPLSKPMPADARNVLMNILDEKLNDITQDKRTKINICSQVFEWLRMFTKLPLEEILSRFNTGSEGRTCLFLHMRTYFNSFAKLFASPISCPEEVFRSLFCINHENMDLWNFSYVPTGDEEEYQKTNESLEHITVINSIIDNIPMKNLGKVVFENSLYVPEAFTPGDNWFQKYREQWRIVLDQRYRLWGKEFRKEEIKKKLKVFFNQAEFPLFPFHTWNRVDPVVHFKYDLSMGFLNFYVKHEYSKYAAIMNVITLEGDFSVKENRREFSDLVTLFNDLQDNCDGLAKHVSVGGEFGLEIMRLDSAVKSKAIVEKIVHLIGDLEEICKEYVDSFEKGCVQFENILLAMLGEKSSAAYGSLTNLNKIMGHENREFRQTLERFSHSLKYAAEIIDEIKKIDVYAV